jgi:hypothetical protein
MYKTNPRKPGDPGWHKGGRPPGPNPKVRHLGRKLPAGRGPLSITLKVRPGIPLRSAAIVREVDETFREGASRGSFRIAGHSLEDDHLHVRVHAKDVNELGRAMKALGASFAFAVNRALGRRTGKVLADRYRILTPVEDGRKTLRCGCPDKAAAPKPGRRPRAR